MVQKLCHCQRQKVHIRQIWASTSTLIVLQLVYLQEHIIQIRIRIRFPSSIFAYRH